MDFLSKKNSSLDFVSSFFFPVAKWKVAVKWLPQLSVRFWLNIADNGFQIRIRSAHSWILLRNYRRFFFLLFKINSIEFLTKISKWNSTIIRWTERTEREWEREENVLLCESSEYVTFVLEIFCECIFFFFFCSLSR